MTMRAARRRYAAERSGRQRQKTERDASPRERRRVAQLLISGAVFVSLVAAKLILPAKMEAISRRLAPALEENIDVEAVFSAVGDFFAGDGLGKSAEAFYQTVFGEQEAPLQDGAPAPPTTESTAGAESTEGAESAENAEGAPPEESAPTEEVQVLYAEEELPQGVSMRQTALGFDYVTPVSGTVSSAFGYREHPLEGGERFHYGLDLAAAEGTPIACFADGTVTAAGESSSYGKYCTVRHADGCTTLYAHCKSLAVASGKAVSKGEKIGEVGATGMATGAHLHFEMQKDGTYLNPIYYVEAA